MRNLRSILVFHPALWGLVVLQSLVIALWIAIDPRISFQPTNIDHLLLAFGACFIVIAVICHKFPASGRPAIAERARLLAIGLIFMLAMFVGIRLLNYLTMSLAFPLADDLLDSWDKAIGIDWYAYASGLGRYPEMLTYIQLPYTLTIPAVTTLFMALVLFGAVERAKEFAALLYMGALVTVCVSGFFPAEAAMARHGDEHLFSVYGAQAGVYHMEALKTLREAKDIVLSFVDLPGLATFPSFHTIVGLLIVYAARDNIITLVPAGIWSAAMLLATPVYGGHYFIDLIAGFFVTAALASAYAMVKATPFEVPRMAATDVSS